MERERDSKCIEKSTRKKGCFNGYNGMEFRA